MKKIYNVQIVFLSIVVWVILNESVEIIDIALGGLFGIVSIYITNKFLLLDDYSSVYNIHFLDLIKYGVFLIVHIYLAGFSTISKIISGKINPDIVEIETTIEDNLYICILANSITLTPGTVTIDKEGRKLKVLWIDCVTKDSKEAGEMIKGKFEKFLLKG